MVKGGITFGMHIYRKFIIKQSHHTVISHKSKFQIGLFYFSATEDMWEVVQ